MKHEKTIFKKLLLKVSKQKSALQYRLVQFMQNKIYFIIPKSKKTKKT